VRSSLSPAANTPDIDEDAHGAPLCFRSLADLMGGAPWHNDIDTQLREELLAVIGDELDNADEALKSKARHAAMVGMDSTLEPRTE
jgi:hypothetical protein